MREYCAAKTPHKTFAFSHTPDCKLTIDNWQLKIPPAVDMRCEPCLKMHLKNARKKGFTQAEIDEAAWMGISFGGSPTMVFYEQNKNP